MKVTNIPTSYLESYYGLYLHQVPQHLDLLTALDYGQNHVLQLLEALPEEKWQYRYEEGKWTIKEILCHLIDTERVFNYRALRFARQDQTALPGFDHNAYVPTSQANDLSTNYLIKSYKVQRESTKLFFEGMTNEMLLSTGIASETELSVAAIGFIQAGHELHHCRVIRERYL
jgi:hypothetical protein